jgi:lipopolysaccharide/colanic/teichoic acid biosynthesis glycosyltransferase
VPFGTNVLIQHVAAAVRMVTNNHPVIVAPEGADAAYAEWIVGFCPSAQVVANAEELAAVVAGHELSDALLMVDPRCLPVQPGGFAQLLRHHVLEPRVSHHLVVFEQAIAGTKERISLDPNGQVRGIQRYYEQTTWPFINGIAATLVPTACGAVADGTLPKSMFELRQLLIGRAVPSRDVPVEGGALDLSDERGLLSANERLILDASETRPGTESPSAPLFVGGGQTIAPGARVMGPIVIHPSATVEAGATVLGPVVIGAGARIGAGAVVAHAVIGPDATVPAGVVVRDRTWFKTADEARFGGSDTRPVSFSERLARLSLEASHSAAFEQQLEPAGSKRHLAVKRGLDIFAAVLGLALSAPLLLLIAAAIWLESRGPIFYGDKREGLRGRGFSCWKFRTMFTGAHLAQRELKALDHTDGPHFKVDRDPRVTRVGRVLRALNVDELPQLFNVLLGQMSLVGPRPSPFRENQVCVPWRSARLSVRPGITGFWQVCRHNRAAGDFHQWIEYDLLYVQHLSLRLDVKILAATFLTLGGKVAHVPASWLVGQSAPVEDIAVSETVQTEREAQVA